MRRVSQEEDELGGSIDDFNQAVASLESYGGQDSNPIVVASEDGGATLRLQGNTWKKLDLQTMFGANYEVTPNTVVALDFKSQEAVEIQGVGLDDDDVINNPRTLFQFTGDQDWGITTGVPAYAGAGWQHYEMQLRDYPNEFNGLDARYLVFANDDDADSQGESFFRNVQLYELRRTSNHYDEEGRLERVDSPEGTIFYEYDALGRLERTYTDQSDIQYGYDALGRLQTVTVVERAGQTISGGEQTTYAYDKVGNLDLAVLPNGVVSDYEYDNLNRLDNLVHYENLDGVEGYQQGGADRLIAKYDYTLRADGKRERLEETGELGSRTYDWAYDELGRLSEERYDAGSDGPGAEDFTATYGYDLASNRVQKTVDQGSDDNVDEAIAYLYDANDRLLAEELDLGDNGSVDRTTTYEYGGPTNPGTRQTEKTVTGDDASTTTYHYNVQGRLKRVDIDEGSDGIEQSITYQYNDEGVRVSAHDSVTGETKLHHIDPQNHTGYAKPIEEGVDDSGDGKLQAAEVDRTYAIGHAIISQADGSAAPLFFVHDGHGSTRALLNGQTVVESYAYDAFGKAIGFDATQATTTWLFANDGQFDQQAGITNHIARWRDGFRFFTMDVFPGLVADPLTLHKYLYAHADPVLFVDPSGLVSSLFGSSPFGLAAHRAITKIYKQDHPSDDTSRSGRWTRLGPKPAKGITGLLYTAKVDLLNDTTKRYAEIKPLSFSGIASGGLQLELRARQFRNTGYQLDLAWTPSTHITTTDLGERIAFVNLAGLVLYTDRWDLAEDVVAIGTVQAARTFFAKYGVQAIVGALGRVPQLATARVTVDSARLDSQFSIAGLIATLGVV